MILKSKTSNPFFIDFQSFTEVHFGTGFSRGFVNFDDFYRFLSIFSLFSKCIIIVRVLDPLLDPLFGGVFWTPVFDPFLGCFWGCARGGEKPPHFGISGGPGSPPKKSLMIPTKSRVRNLAPGRPPKITGNRPKIDKKVNFFRFFCFRERFFAIFGVFLGGVWTPPFWPPFWPLFWGGFLTPLFDPIFIDFYRFLGVFLSIGWCHPKKGVLCYHILWLLLKYPTTQSLPSTKH